MHAPHGIRVLKGVLDAGIRSFLAGHGFERRRFTFTRRRGALTETIVLCIRTPRTLMVRSFWLVAEAELHDVEVPARLEVAHKAWGYDLGRVGDPATFLDTGDFAVGLAETIVRHVLPAFDTLHEPLGLARALEEQRHFDAAIAAWRRAGDEGNAARLTAWLAEQF